MTANPKQAIGGAGALIARVFELDGLATKGPWQLDHDGYFVAAHNTGVSDWDWIVCAEGTPGDDYSPEFSVEDHYGKKVLENNKCIAEYRTACPRLAKALSIAITMLKSGVFNPVDVLDEIDKIIGDEK